ncbi:MAG: ABC transporter substrate-binding protein [Oscillospiraceae bacterium]|jgi:putative aldouronate transport system substrate-binding protein|nr:ABC transporter substrate-binding protein [Oscillospiraceae bacterium]
MKKRILAILLGSCLALSAFTACDKTETTEETTTAGTTTAADANAETTTPAPVEVEAGQFEGVTVTVAYMTSAAVNSGDKARIEGVINEYVGEKLGGLQVKWLEAGPAWSFDTVTQQIQSGSADFDILPAFSWSAPTVLAGAQSGQFLRLDDPDNNLLQSYGSGLFTGAAGAAMKGASTYAGPDGVGVYAVAVEKDGASDGGYLVNNDVLAAADKSISDLNLGDFTSWGDTLQAVKDSGVTFPLVVEAEVLDRIVNHVAYVGNTTTILGIQFGSDPASAPTTIVNRYATDDYSKFVDTVNGYYSKGFIDPATTIQDSAPDAITTARNAGTFAVATYLADASGAATNPAAATQNITYHSQFLYMDSLTSTGAGFALYAGTKNADAAAAFLGLWFTDATLNNYINWGEEGTDFTLSGNVATAIEGKDHNPLGAWQNGSGLLQVAGSYETVPNAFTNQQAQNAAAKILSSMGYQFDASKAEVEFNNTGAWVASNAVPLGAGAVEVSKLAALLTELESAGASKLVTEAQAQLDQFLAG